MEIILASFSICLAAAAIILLLRLLCYRKQINHIKEQLLFLKAEESNYMLTSAYPVGKTEELINIMNDVIEDYRKRHRRLRKVNQSYRESITSISHDIRTPLTSIKGYVQMQKSADISQEKKAEYLKRNREMEEELDCYAGVRGMSKETAWILGGADPKTDCNTDQKGERKTEETAKLRRMDNYAFLDQRLRGNTQFVPVLDYAERRCIFPFMPKTGTGSSIFWGRGVSMPPCFG